MTIEIEAFCTYLDVNFRPNVYKFCITYFLYNLTNVKVLVLKIFEVLNTYFIT